MSRWRNISIVIVVVTVKQAILIHRIRFRHKWNINLPFVTLESGPFFEEFGLSKLV